MSEIRSQIVIFWCILSVRNDVKFVTVLSVLEDNENQVDANEGRFIFLKYAILSAGSITYSLRGTAVLMGTSRR
jgi:hypothetical protein